MQKSSLPIRTDTFILRKLRMSDAESLAKHANERLVAKNLSLLPYPYTLEFAKKWLNKSCKDYLKKFPNSFSYAIEIDGEAVGYVSFNFIVHGHEAEIVYWIGKKYWGRGLMTKIIETATHFAMKKFHLKRIYAYTFPFNKASKRVLEKNKFRFEGIARKGVRKGKICLDADVYSKVI